MEHGRPTRRHRELQADGWQSILSRHVPAGWSNASQEGHDIFLRPGVRTSFIKNRPSERCLTLEHRPYHVFK